MNFFTVGFILSSINFNLGHPATYLLKAIGCLFLIGGIKELMTIDKSYGKFSGGVYISLAISAVGSVLSGLMSAGVIKESAVNIISIIIGTLAILSVTFLQYRIIKSITADKSLVNDTSLLFGLAKAWNRLAFFTLINLVCNILYRLLPQSTAQNVAGTVQFITLFLVYIYIAVMGSAFNKARMDFNVTHPI